MRRNALIILSVLTVVLIAGGKTHVYRVENEAHPYAYCGPKECLLFVETLYRGWDKSLFGVAGSILRSFLPVSDPATDYRHALKVLRVTPEGVQQFTFPDPLNAHSRSAGWRSVLFNGSLYVTDTSTIHEWTGSGFEKMPHGTLDDIMEAWHHDKAHFADSGDISKDGWSLRNLYRWGAMVSGNINGQTISLTSDGDTSPSGAPNRSWVAVTTRGNAKPEIIWSNDQSPKTVSAKEYFELFRR